MAQSDLRPAPSELNIYNPPVIKHGNGRSQIYRWFLHSNLYLKGFFRLPPLSTGGDTLLVVFFHPVDNCEWFKCGFGVPPQHRKAVPSRVATWRSAFAHGKDVESAPELKRCNSEVSRRSESFKTIYYIPPVPGVFFALHTIYFLVTCNLSVQTLQNSRFRRKTWVDPWHRPKPLVSMLY